MDADALESTVCLCVEETLTVDSVRTAGVTATKPLQYFSMNY